MYIYYYDLIFKIHFFNHLNLSKLLRLFVAIADLNVNWNGLINNNYTTMNAQNIPRRGHCSFFMSEDNAKKLF